MRFRLFWLLLWSLLTKKGYCQSPHLPVPRNVRLDSNQLSQTLFVTWENELPSIVHLFDVEVLRSELMQPVYFETITVAPEPSSTVHRWNWVSPTPLECTSLLVRVRSRLQQFTSEWSSLTLPGKDIPNFKKAQVFPQDKVVPVGSNTTFCCILEKGKKIGSIMAGKSSLPFTRISSRTYESVWINQPASGTSGSNVVCLYESSNGQLANGAVVFVGYPPAPENLVCETRDLESVECSWSLGPSTHLQGSRRTLYSLNERDCDNANRIVGAEYKCRFTVTLQREERNWTLTARNPLGKAELTDTVDLNHRVRPLAPVVSVDVVEAWNASVRWHWKMSRYGMLPLMCQVRVVSKGQSVSRTYPALGLNRTLPDLRPDESYSVQVRCASQKNFWKWGDWSSESQFRTKEDRPDPVDVWVQMHSELDGCVMWKPLTKSQCHGQITAYQVSGPSMGNTGQPTNVSLTGPYHFPFSLEGSASDHVVTVTARNNAGDSPANSFTIPSFLPDHDDALLKIVGDAGAFHLSWSASPNSTCGYVVAWYCTSLGSNCSLDWVKLHGDNTSATIQSESFKAGESYTISVYACTPEAPLLLGKMLGYVEEQGEVKLSPPVVCHDISLVTYRLTRLFVLEAPTKTVTGLRADQQGSSVRLSWSAVPFEGQRGFIHGYVIYLYNLTQLELLANITDPSIMNYTVRRLSFSTYKFTVKAYTSAGLGKEATVSIKLDPFTDLLIMEILIAAGCMTVLLVLVTTLCYSKREWMKKTFYPEIPEPKLPEWTPTQVLSTQTLDMKPCTHSSVHIVENPSQTSKKEELTVVLEEPAEDNQWGNEPADTDSDEQSFLRYYNQVVGEDPGLAPPGTGLFGSSSRSAGSVRTEVTYTGIQTSSSSAMSCSSACIPVPTEAPVSCGYRPQVDAVPNVAQAEKSDDTHLDSVMGYQPQCSWKVDSPEETSLDSSLGSPTSVSSSQFLLPEPSEEVDSSTAPPTTWFRSLLSGSGKP